MPLESRWAVERICMTLEIDKAHGWRRCAQRLDAIPYSYERRGIRLIKLENSYQLCSAPEYRRCDPKGI